MTIQSTKQLTFCEYFTTGPRDCALLSMQDHLSALNLKEVRYKAFFFFFCLICLYLLEQISNPESNILHRISNHSVSFLGFVLCAIISFSVSFVLYVAVDIIDDKKETLLLECNQVIQKMSVWFNFPVCNFLYIFLFICCLSSQFCSKFPYYQRDITGGVHCAVLSGCVIKQSD